MHFHLYPAHLCCQSVANCFSTLWDHVYAAQLLITSHSRPNTMAQTVRIELCFSQLQIWSLAQGLACWRMICRRTPRRILSEPASTVLLQHSGDVTGKGQEEAEGRKRKGHMKQISLKMFLNAYAESLHEKTNQCIRKITMLVHPICLKWICKIEIPKWCSRNGNEISRCRHLSDDHNSWRFTLGPVSHQVNVFSRVSQCAIEKQSAKAWFAMLLADYSGLSQMMIQTERHQDQR